MQAMEVKEAMRVGRQRNGNGNRNRNRNRSRSRSRSRRAAGSIVPEDVAMNKKTGAEAPVF